MYKQREPFTVTFDTRGAMAGYGVQHEDLASYSAGIMSTVIIGGGEPVCFPPPCRKIQFRIVVRYIGHLGNPSGPVRLTRIYYYIIVAWLRHRQLFRYDRHP